MDPQLILEAFKRDHVYAKCDDDRVDAPSTAVTVETASPVASCSVPPQETAVTTTGLQYRELVGDSDPENIIDDPEYVPQSSDVTSSDSEDDYSSEEEELTEDLFSIPHCPDNPAEQRKFLVFESSLMELFQTCRKKGCSAEVTGMQQLISGSRLIVKTKCSSGCSCIWSSQPLLSKMGAGNLLLSAAVLFSGNTYTRLYDIADHLNMPILSESRFYALQQKYLFPVVNETWLSMQIALLDGLSGEKDIMMCGDGRCDSPGHCAKYGTYTLMDGQFGYVTEFFVSNTADENVKNSNAMEPMGLKKCLAAMKKFDITISVLATDRHPSVRKIMREEYPQIQHQFDVWHLAKSVIKKLGKRAKKVEGLSVWMQSVSNHLWWCSMSCNSSADVLLEKWESIVYHTVNIHSWNDKKHFHACEHPPLAENDRKGKAWLRVGSEAHDVLKKVVLDKLLLKDVRHITGFCHTGQLEVYHSVLLKYAPKRQHFSYEGMWCRTQLAAIDHNYHVGRKQAVTRTGRPRFSIVYPKSFSGKRKWVAKTVKTEKDYPYRDDMMKDVVNLRVLKLRKKCAKLPTVKRNTAPIDRPDKEEVIRQTRQYTRFACKK